MELLFISILIILKRKSFGGRAMHDRIDENIFHTANRELEEETGFAYGDGSPDLASLSSPVPLFDLISDVSPTDKITDRFTVFCYYNEENTYEFLSIFFPFH